MPIQISDKAREVIAKISLDEKSDIYLYSGPINEGGYGSIVRSLAYQQPSVILILATYGGSANSAYRISRLFQALYKRFTVLTLSYCKSAGTLVSTGAHRLLMGESAELGPLDVQLSKRDELWEQRSGLLLRSALTSLAETADELYTQIMVSIKANSKGVVRFRLASEIASRLTRGLMSPIYSQITPEGLGEDHQELMVAFEYAKRLAEVGGLISEQSIKKLVHDYPSHDFVIDKVEARGLFREVQDPTKDMYALGTAIPDLVYSPDSKVVTAEALHPVQTDDTKANATDGTTNEQSAADEEPKSATGDGATGSTPAP